MNTGILCQYPNYTTYKITYHTYSYLNYKLYLKRLHLSNIKLTNYLTSDCHVIDCSGFEYNWLMDYRWLKFVGELLIHEPQGQR